MAARAAARSSASSCRVEDTKTRTRRSGVLIPGVAPEASWVKATPRVPAAGVRDAATLATGSARSGGVSGSAE